MRKLYISCALTEGDRERATLFVQEGYKKAFNIIPSGVAWYVTVSDESGRLRSVLGIQICRSEESPLHALYDVTRCEFPADYDPRHSAYYSRFVSYQKGISPLMFYVATQYALEGACTYGSAVFLPYMLNRFSAMNCGDVWKPLANATLRIDSLTPDYLSYFTNPELKCYLANLQQKADRLKPLVEELCVAHTIFCDSNADRYLAAINRNR